MGSRGEGRGRCAGGEEAPSTIQPLDPRLSLLSPTPRPDASPRALQFSVCGCRADRQGRARCANFGTWLLVASSGAGASGPAAGLYTTPAPRLQPRPTSTDTLAGPQMVTSHCASTRQTDANGLTFSRAGSKTAARRLENPPQISSSL